MTSANNAEESAPELTFIASLRTARATAIAGIVFAIIMLTVMLLTRNAFPYDVYLESGVVPAQADLERADWALRLMPFGGIAFLWFIAALNYNLGDADNRLFSIVFTGSGLIYISLAFVGGAIASGEIAALERGMEFSDSTRVLAAQAVNELLITYGFKMAAVFALSLSTFGRVRKVLPLWLTLLGSATGILLLFVPIGFRQAEFAFPIWVALVSLHIFVAYPAGKLRAQAAAA